MADDWRRALSIYDYRASLRTPFASCASR